MAKKQGNEKEFSWDDLKGEMKKYSHLGSTLDKNDFATIKYTVNSGNYMLNALMTGSLLKGYPAGRMIELAGEKSTGKTFCLLNAVKHAQDMGMQVLYYDTETAIDKDVLAEGFGFNMEDIWYEPQNIIEHIKIHLYKTIQLLVEKKRAGFQIPKLFIVIDSLGNLASLKEHEDAVKEEIKVDMTRAKAIASIFRLIAIPLNEIEATLVYSNHVYADTSSFIGGNVGKGGKSREYISSVLVQFYKSKGKDDGVTKNGVIVRAKTGEKNRFAIPGEIQFHIDFRKGMNPYIGLPFLGLPFKQDWFVDLEKEGWDDFGLQYGKIIDNSTFENVATKKGTKYQKEITEIQNTQYELNGNVYYFVDRNSVKKLELGGLRDLKIAVKHLAKEVSLGEFFTSDVFTQDILEKIDETIIKPKFAYKNPERHDDILDELELSLDSESDLETENYDEFDIKNVFVE